MKKDSAILLTKLIPLVMLLFFSMAIIRADLAYAMDFGFLWAVVIFGSIVFLGVNIANSHFISPAVILMSAYLGLLLIGTVLYEQFRANYLDESTRNLIGLGYLGLLVGLYMANLIYARTVSAHKSIVVPTGNSKFALMVVGFSGVVAALVLFGISGVPLFSSSVNHAKIALYSGKGYINIFFIALPFVSIVFLHRACVLNDRVELFRSNLLLALVGTLLLLAAFRATLLVYVLEYVCLYFYFYPKKIGYLKVFATSAFLLTIVFVLGAFRRGSLSVTSIVEEIGITLTARPTMVNVITKRVAEATYGVGQYLTDVGKILPGVQKGGNTLLKEDIFGSRENMSDLAGLNPSIVGETYMNLGASYVFFVLVCIGFITSFFYYRFLKDPSAANVLIYFIFVFGSVIALLAGIGSHLPRFLIHACWVAVILALYQAQIRRVERS